MHRESPYAPPALRPIRRDPCTKRVMQKVIALADRFPKEMPLLEKVLDYMDAHRKPKAS